MKVTELETMEEIVQNNRRLFWDGWDVYEWVLRRGAELSVNGLLHNNRWGVVKHRVTVDRNGWEVPDGWITTVR